MPFARLMAPFASSGIAKLDRSRSPDSEPTLQKRRHMHRIARSGRAEEIGEAAWTIGQYLAVAGGYTIR
jgi:hypothetical protein